MHVPPAPPPACILPLVCVGTSRVTVKGHVRQFTGSTHTFALEWVQEVPTHLAVVSRRPRRVVHAPHVIGGALQGRDRRQRGHQECWQANKGLRF